MDIGFGQTSIRVIIAGDRSETLAEIRNSLMKYPEIKILGECTDSAETLALARQTHPDLVILAPTNPQEDSSGWQSLQKSLLGTVRMVLYTTAEVSTD